VTLNLTAPTQRPLVPPLEERLRRRSHTRQRLTASGGRPEHVPDENSRSLVETLAAHGTPHRIIASVTGISRSTLRRHYKPQLSEGFETVKAKVQSALAARAMAGDLGAMRVWLARWCPEWRLPKEDAQALSEADTAVRQQALAEAENAEVVHFFLPPNHRDIPLQEATDQGDGPVIEGEATAAA